MTEPSDNPLRKLMGEIHRRSLWQVLGIYLVVVVRTVARYKYDIPRLGSSHSGSRLSTFARK